MRFLKPGFPSLRIIYSHSSWSYIECQLYRFLSGQKTSRTNTRTAATLESLLRFHALIITSGNSNNIFIASKLISLYASFSRTHFSDKVFDLVHPKDIFLWNSIIKAHFSSANCTRALDLYLAMRLLNNLPNHFTIPMVVSACAELLQEGWGKWVHGLTFKCGLFADNSAVGSSFVYMYAKCSYMEDASLVFDEIQVRDVVAWTAVIIGYVQNGKNEKALCCLCDMHSIGGDDERPNFRTLEGAFHACGNLGGLIEGRCLHGLVVKNGLVHSQIVRASILSMYSKCGNPEEACLSFYEVDDKDLLTWTSIIGVHARFRFMKECIFLFWEMQAGGVHPDGIVISCMLSGFGNAMKVNEGKAFHGLIMRRRYLLDQIVHSALLSMYCKLGLLSTAEKLFDRIQTEAEADKDSWNMMVICYGKMGHKEKCLELFREMQCLGIESDSVSLVSAISACSHLEAGHLGQSIHCYVVKNYMDGDISVVNSLIDMYGKNGTLTTAWRMFNRTKRDIVTWNTQISSYVYHGKSDEAIALFNKMISENMKPNLATLVIVLSACSHLASLDKGESVHHYIKEAGYELSPSLATALIDMYAKCGQLKKSRELFDAIKEKDAICWNVMISGYGMHGDAESAIQIFQQMEKSSVEPNELTFLALFSACAYAGLVEEGKYLFGRMQRYCVKPNLKHFACMVDLLARSGNLQDAEALILSMPVSPDGGMWGTILNSCKIHNEIEMGVRMAKCAIESDPKNDGYYVILANMYSSIGKWQEAERAREMMKERGVGKRAGWSSV